jgi:hypothetical protein
VAVGPQDGELVVGGRVPDRDAHQEAVALGLGQGVGALELDRVLGRDDHEGGGELVGGPVDGDGPLLHALEHRRLRLRTGTVDLVAEDEVGEDRSGPELELAGVGGVDGDTRHVARQQVRRELHAGDAAVDGARERLGEHRLADTRDVLDEQVPSASRVVSARSTTSGLPSSTDRMLVPMRSMVPRTLARSGRWRVVPRAMVTGTEAPRRAGPGGLASRHGRASAALVGAGTMVTVVTGRARAPGVQSGTSRG